MGGSPWVSPAECGRGEKAPSSAPSLQEGPWGRGWGLALLPGPRVVQELKPRHTDGSSERLRDAQKKMKKCHLCARTQHGQGTLLANFQVQADKKAEARSLLPRARGAVRTARSGGGGCPRERGGQAAGDGSLGASHGDSREARARPPPRPAVVTRGYRCVRAGPGGSGGGREGRLSRPGDGGGEDS